MNAEIYLDHSATTPLSPEALEAYLTAARAHYGNPSSLHRRGSDAEEQLAAARTSLLRAIGAGEAGGVVFCGSGSEANNLAILGRSMAKERYARGKVVLTTAGEHASVRQPLARLASLGWTVREIPTRGGVLDMQAFADALTPDVVLATMMMVNNETGAWYDLAAAASLLHARCPEALLHCDATQAFLKVPFRVRGSGIDLLTVSAHKVEGPKGVAALWVAPDVLKNRGIAPLILGGGQEGGLRSGTENVPGIAAFGCACRMGAAEFPARAARLAALRAHVLTRLASDGALCEVRPNLPPRAAPHILNLTLPHIKSETMLQYLSGRGIYVSSGSACSSHGKHTSAALAAFGLPPQEADCSIRVSLSHRTTEEELDCFATALGEGVASLVRIR